MGLDNLRRNNLEKELSELSKARKSRGNIAAVFKLKESIVGKKVSNQEASSVIDPLTNTEVNTVEGIKLASLNYCKSLLTNRDPKPGYIDILDEKYKLHEKRMKEHIPEEESELTFEMFNGAVARLKAKNPDKYKFILKGGNSLLNVLFVIFHSIWENENIPDGWKKTNIIQIHKKGPRNELSNYRNIHTKVESRKLFGEILTNELKVKVDNVI